MLLKLSRGKQVEKLLIFNEILYVDMMKISIIINCELTLTSALQHPIFKLKVIKIFIKM